MIRVDSYRSVVVGLWTCVGSWICKDLLWSVGLPGLVWMCMDCYGLFVDLLGFVWTCLHFYRVVMACLWMCVDFLRIACL